ncbi:hypothetical protein ACFXTI_047360 [Malus domestica]
MSDWRVSFSGNKNKGVQFPKMLRRLVPDKSVITCGGEAGVRQRPIRRIVGLKDKVILDAMINEVMAHRDSFISSFKLFGFLDYEVTCIALEGYMYIF